MRALRAWGVLAGCLAATLFITGCPKQQESAGPSGGGTHYTIAVVPKGTAQSFWLAVKAGAQDACNEANATMDWNGPESETDIPRQIDIIRTAISRHDSAIVMAACGAKEEQPIVKQAMDQGLPVVVIDSGIDPDTSTAFLATDNVKGGDQAADALAKVLNGKGKIAVINFIKGAGSADDREKGFKQGIQRHAGLDLGNRVYYCDADVSKAMTKVQGLLASTPDVAGIFATNQAGAEGTIQELKQAGKAGKIKLVCFDASDPEIAALKDGTVDALIVQNPYKMGYEGVKTALKALHKEPIAQHTIDTGVTVVTRDNLNTPDVQKLLTAGTKK